MAINFDEIASAMLAAMRPILTGAWQNVAGFASMEARKLAVTFVDIEAMLGSNPPQVSRAVADALIDSQKQAAQAVLQAVEGVGIIAAQQAVNAAVNAVSGIVNKAVGFALV
jgi:hypothetical protein